MKTSWPLLILALLPGCTFYSSSNGNIVPRSAAELKEVSPALYIVIGLFCLILVACVGAMLFQKSEPDASGRFPEDKVLAFFLAALSTAVVLLLVG
jgi:nitrate reductase NapE component